MVQQDPRPVPQTIWEQWRVPILWIVSCALMTWAFAFMVFYANGDEFPVTSYYCVLRPEPGSNTEGYPDVPFVAHLARMNNPVFYTYYPELYEPHHQWLSTVVDPTMDPAVEKVAWIGHPNTGMTFNTRTLYGEMQLDVRAIYSMQCRRDDHE